MSSIKNQVNKMAPLLVIFFTLSALFLESVEGKKMTYPLLMPHVRPTVVSIKVGSIMNEKPVRPKSVVDEK